MRFPFRAILFGVIFGAALFFFPFGFTVLFFVFFIFFLSRFFFGWGRGYRRDYGHRYHGYYQSGITPIDGDRPYQRTHSGSVVQKINID